MVQPPQQFVASPTAMSDSLPSPSPEESNRDAERALPQGSNTQKRKFGTVEPARPTPAKRRLTSFIDVSYDGKNSGPKSPKFKNFVKKAMAIYNYDDCPLPENHIRLLFLKPSDDPSGAIIVELRAFPIDDLVNNPDDYQFTALSYNWGEGSENNDVFVDMEADTEPPPKMNFGDVSVAFKRRMRRLQVKPNLYTFLQQFRDSKTEVALWVDRVCINQASNQEKQDQVSRMSMIYSTATNVSIWLGPADQDGKTDRAMDFIPHLLRDQVEQKLAANYANEWAELLLLIRRRWFSRRWIIQELALSKNAEVRCGSKRNHWKDVSDAISIFALRFDVILKIIECRPDLKKSLEGIKDLNPFGARILVDVLSNTFQRHPDGTVSTPRQGLESLISSLSTFETSDPRDTVYTLLNLAKETCKLRQNVVLNERRRKKRQTNAPPKPDYTMDLLEVYTHFVKWCIKESGSLDILCRHWALPEVKQKLDDFYPRIVILPSWITTVRDSAYGPQAEGFGGRRTGDSFVGTPETRCYNASLGMTPDVLFGRDQGIAPRRMSNPKPPNGTGNDIVGTVPRLPPTSGRAITRVPRSQQDLSRSITIKGYCIGQVNERHQMPEGIIPKKVLNILGHDGESTELESVPDAVWRTLVADRGPDGKTPPAWYHRACMTCLVANTNAGNIDTNSILSQDETTGLQSDYLKRVQAVCWNRTFIKCGNEDDGNKLVGIGPGEAEQDDLVCILYGCSVPCILRETWYGSDSTCYYQLVGEAFILGQMDGEAIMDFSDEYLKNVSENFTLI
ncbi:hypothetical protein QQX98_008600 [Neonectria punicea]|uniref:Heterokaryon incompatibility domain-containing protein n=1 Tax=Neonectria punicea TaxID=979145 RepID=A0ABR1GV51_9HYPO